MKRLLFVGGLAAALLAIPISHFMIGKALANIGGDGTNGECAVDDGFFASASGGCMDLTTGLVWSSDPSSVLPFVTQHSDPNEGCRFSPEGGNDSLYSLSNNDNYNGGYTDWRLPTVGEVQEALGNGLNSHLDFSYDAGFQAVDDVYRYTLCHGKKIRGNGTLVRVSYLNGDTFDSNEFGVPIICVRGQDPLANSCPGDTGGGEKGKPKN